LKPESITGTGEEHEESMNAFKVGSKLEKRFDT
jgi:hypothetical protein